MKKVRTHLFLVPLQPMYRSGQSVEWRQKEEEEKTRHKEEKRERERKVGCLQVG